MCEKKYSIHTIFYRNNFILKSFKLKWVRLYMYIKYKGLAFCTCIWKLTNVFSHVHFSWSIFNLYIPSLIVLRNLVAYIRFLHHLNFQMITNSTYKYLVKYRGLTVARELKEMRRVIEIKEMFRSIFIYINQLHVHHFFRWLYIISLDKSTRMSALLANTINDAPTIPVKTADSLLSVALRFELRKEERFLVSTASCFLISARVALSSLYWATWLVMLLQ